MDGQVIVTLLLLLIQRRLDLIMEASIVVSIFFSIIRI